MLSEFLQCPNHFKRHVVSLGAEGDKIRVIGNGIDAVKLYPLDKAVARAELNIPEDAKVLISVGALVDRKGFHRVIEVFPALVETYPELIYLIVGGDSPEGNIREHLEYQVKTLKLEKNVRFLGAYPSEKLKTPLSAADLFVLATANEGWANVFLEAMACGLPVITTEVGGNKEVVNDPKLGLVVPFDDSEALLTALIQALETTWNRPLIVQYARENSWDSRVKILVEEFQVIVS